MASRAREVSAVSEELFVTGGAKIKSNGVVDYQIATSNISFAHIRRRKPGALPTRLGLDCRATDNIVSKCLVRPNLETRQHHMSSGPNSH